MVSAVSTPWSVPRFHGQAGVSAVAWRLHGRSRGGRWTRCPPNPTICVGQRGGEFRAGGLRRQRPRRRTRHVPPRCRTCTSLDATQLWLSRQHRRRRTLEHEPSCARVVCGPVAVRPDARGRSGQCPIQSQSIELCRDRALSPRGPSCSDLHSQQVRHAQPCRLGPWDGRHREHQRVD